MLKNDERIRPYLDRSNFLTIRYEDLVCELEATARRLYDFLGCDFAPGYLRYDPQRDRYPDRWSWVAEAAGPVDPRHASKWKEEVSLADIERVTTMAACFIERYGYDR